MFTNDSPSCNPATASSWIHPTRPQSICSITRCFCTLVFPFPPHKAEFNQSTGSAGSFNSVCVFIHVYVTVKCAALALIKSFKSSVNCSPRINSPTWKQSVIPGSRSTTLEINDTNTNPATFQLNTIVPPVRQNHSTSECISDFPFHLPRRLSYQLPYDPNEPYPAQHHDNITVMFQLA